MALQGRDTSLMKCLLKIDKDFSQHVLNIQQSNERLRSAEHTIGTGFRIIDRLISAREQSGADSRAGAVALRLRSWRGQSPLSHNQ
ncbi:unnamed protein product [Pieris macdunnoughi]|uniref:Uncharacterized protein n=1 Tax=Pieris macdunnoughi TaxID=345717 RepID=A0A821NCQ1_9NEOP|nr:unnamed protein product [Pieris macdunnoughi]